jgi:hypothetical protein
MLSLFEANEDLLKIKFETDGLELKTNLSQVELNETTFRFKKLTKGIFLLFIFYASFFFCLRMFDLPEKKELLQIEKNRLSLLSKLTFLKNTFERQSKFYILYFTFVSCIYSNCWLYVFKVRYSNWKEMSGYTLYT